MEERIRWLILVIPPLWLRVSSVAGGKFFFGLGLDDVIPCPILVVANGAKER
jgi:hypothetical protein